MEECPQRYLGDHGVAHLNTGPECKSQQASESLQRTPVMAVLSGATELCCPHDPGPVSHWQAIPDPEGFRSRNRRIVQERSPQRTTTGARPMHRSTLEGKITQSHGNRDAWNPVGSTSVLVYPEGRTHFPSGPEGRDSWIHVTLPKKSLNPDWTCTSSGDLKGKIS